MSSSLLLDSVVLPLVDGTKILEIGCGLGKWGYLLRSCWSWAEAGGKQDHWGAYLEPEYLVGIDLWLPSLRKVKYHKIYDDVIMCDALHLPFKNNCFDVVMAIEVVEHIEDKNKDYLYREAERVSKKTIIITTPRYPGRRGGVQTPDGTNIYERHVSSTTMFLLQL